MFENATALETRRAALQSALGRETCRVLVCGGLGCLAKGAQEVFEAIRTLVAEQGLAAAVELAEHKPGARVVKTGCAGLCEAGPIVVVQPHGYMFVRVKAEDAAEIVEQAVKAGQPVTRLLPSDNGSGPIVRMDETAFYRKQHKIALRNCGVVDPESLDDYLAHDGYAALTKVLAGMSPEQVIAEVEQSGLRGRGGAGFPTGRKWRFAAAAEGDQKYVICNGDEGDPGAFMDRCVMEGDPFSVIEGMTLAGYAIGASEGYIYVRAEYPLAVQRLRAAIKQAEAAGLLGKHILGSELTFRLHVKEGAGAFVCGEESALIASIEGERGMPRPKPPFPAQRGLWAKPTIINNVETLANVPAIVAGGADMFRSFGTERSPGTKTFSLSGKVINTGLVEVPLGTPLRTLIFEMGGGIRGGKAFKAVQIGGPSGGCLTSEHLDLPVDYESLTAAGAIVGSGGLVVVDEATCMIEMARFFMEFTQSESCGKCVPCREGTKRMLEILTRITQGKGTMDDLALLEELAPIVKDASLCGLGKTAPNPVLTTLRYFRHEYLAHIQERRCPAGACKALLGYAISPDLCRGCTKCARVCPVGAISGEIKQTHVIDAAKCIRCGACKDACPFKAVVLK